VVKKIIYGLLIILWMMVIFNFSNSNGISSDSLSRKLINKIVLVYEDITDSDVDNEYYMDKLDYPVRKLAHFTEYAILGFLTVNFCLSFNMLYAYIFSALICFLYAMSDEFHQLFVTGRSGQFKDVLIDTFGSITMIFIINLLNKVKNNHLK
jgi:VanZ family protein